MEPHNRMSKLKHIHFNSVPHLEHSIHKNVKKHQLLYRPGKEEDKGKSITQLFKEYMQLRITQAERSTEYEKDFKIQKQLIYGLTVIDIDLLNLFFYQHLQSEVYEGITLDEQLVQSQSMYSIMTKNISVILSVLKSYQAMFINIQRLLGLALAEIETPLPNIDKKKNVSLQDRLRIDSMRKAFREAYYGTIVTPVFGIGFKRFLSIRMIKFDRRIAAIEAFIQENKKNLPEIEEQYFEEQKKGRDLSKDAIEFVSKDIGLDTHAILVTTLFELMWDQTDILARVKKAGEDAAEEFSEFGKEMERNIKTLEEYCESRTNRQYYNTLRENFINHRLVNQINHHLSYYLR